MKLSAVDLRAIADAMDKVETLGITVNQFECAGHNVMLKRVSTGMNEVGLAVVGLTNGKFSVGREGTHG